MLLQSPIGGLIGTEPPRMFITVRSGTMAGSALSFAIQETFR
jgi:hypothetical protein